MAGEPSTASRRACCSTGGGGWPRAARKWSGIDNEVIGAARVRQLEGRIRELERLLGRKTLEVEILKARRFAPTTEVGAGSQARSPPRGQKNRCCAGRCPSWTVPDEGGGRHAGRCAQRGGSRPRPRYRKAGDAELLARIRPLVDARPSYGYRRVAALLNRQAEVEGLARVNHKRVYRVMKRARLLLAPHTGRGRQRRHDGEVATPASNRRWAADVFEIPCWNGDAVRVGALDQAVVAVGLDLLEVVGVGDRAAGPVPDRV